MAPRTINKFAITSRLQKKGAWQGTVLGNAAQERYSAVKHLIFAVPGAPSRLEHPTRPEDLEVVTREHFISTLAKIAAFPHAPPRNPIVVQEHIHPLAVLLGMGNDSAVVLMFVDRATEGSCAFYQPPPPPPREPPPHCNLFQRLNYRP
jgi:hypothetical protein